MNRPPNTIRLGEGDDVVVARVALSPGDVVDGDGEGVVVAASVPPGHKVATRSIRGGSPIHKLGQVIGFAAVDIRAGEHVHVHNCTHADPDNECAPTSRAHPTPYVAEADRASFMGFRRESGAVGTRNYIGVLTTVNCAATVARHACTRIEASGLLDDYPSVDGVVPIVHSTGCGMAGDGAGMQVLQRKLAGYVRHPNFAAVLTVGLGCEVCQTSSLFEAQALEQGDWLRALTIQESHGTRQTIEAIEERVREMLPLVQAEQRTLVPASELVLALQCGGSDGYSTITGNPALGAAADLLIRHGGTAILSETPEIYGAHHLLGARAETTEVAARLLDLVDWWKAYVATHGGSLDNNPTPGNHEGGITTILEKSLGATAKGGGRPTSGACTGTLSGRTRADWCLWTARGSTLARSPGRSQQARTSSASPPEEAPCSAIDPVRRSRSRRAAACSRRCRKTWTSTPAPSPTESRP